MKTNNLIGLCVHVPTEEAFTRACEIAMDCGFEVQSGLTFYRYGDDTCIRFDTEGSLFFASQQFYTNKGYSILTMENLEKVVLLVKQCPETPPKPQEVAFTPLPLATEALCGLPLPQTYPPMPTCKPSKQAPVVSDGGSTAYYEITITNKAGETLKCQMGDVIRAVVADNFNLGNILKACRRISEAMQGRGKAGTSITYDCNKIKYSSDEVAHFHGKKLDS